uniref:AMMECR1 domain-containing protein n=1 Tax=Heterorhabditis bacteriophora TaxID=37862 RepID=A0A1I7W6X3_HETBA
MDGRTKRDAVYLPEVATEQGSLEKLFIQGWDHRTTINNLIEKGGYRGMIDETFRMTIQVTRFQSSKVNLTYEDYIHYKRGHH